MATPIGRTDPAISRLLSGFAIVSEGHTFNFFQAVRLAERLSCTVRFHAHQSRSFPASAIQQVAEDKSVMNRLHVTINFLGLTGPQGVLPSHYTDALVKRAIERDHATAAFFDIFNHRFTFWFYRAWEKHFVPTLAEKSGASLRSTTIGRALGSFTGISTSLESAPREVQADEISGESLLLYAGLILQRPHSASALASILSDWFQVPATVESMRGKWLQIDPSEQTCLADEDVSNQVGFGALAGDRVWDCQAQYRIRFGPLSRKRFLAFRPGAKPLRALSKIARFFSGSDFDFDLQLVLKNKDVPAAILGDSPPILGFSSWLSGGPEADDPGDCILDPENGLYGAVT